MESNKVCVKCGVDLNDENWQPSHRKNYDYVCKECNIKKGRQWRQANIEKYKATYIRAHRKQGQRPLNENKECSSYLGVYIAERVLSHVFKDVKRMPYGNPGYDVICNRDKLIDIKSSCIQKDGRWSFTINHNTTADFFLCIAFDNREDLTPLHAWLLPGAKVSHLTGASISLNMVDKWDAYRLDLSKITTCCDIMRG